MKLLLHACCGPCSLEPVRLLREEGHDLTIHYANSNIAPAQEYAHRLDTLRLWAQDAGVPVMEGTYNPDAWEAAAGRIGDEALDKARESAEAQECVGASRELAIDPDERQKRCRACYRLRFEETARVAAAQGFDAIGTTLSVSPYQYTDTIREELTRAAACTGIDAIFRDFRPYYNEATRRSREAHLYRQNYCGCRFSVVEAATERVQAQARREAERTKRAARVAAQATEQAAKQAERRAYDEKQAHKRAVLKMLRDQQRHA